MKIQILIEYEQETGKVSCSGPVDNKILCYGLLEACKEQISRYVPNPIAKPQAGEILTFSRKQS